MTRTVRICTISMNSLVHSAQRASKEEILQEAEAKMELDALDEPDLFLLPEVFLLNGTPEAWLDPVSVEEEGNETYGGSWPSMGCELVRKSLTTSTWCRGKPEA